MSDLQLDLIQALDDARVQEVPYVVAISKRTNKQVIMPLSAINGRYIVLYVCLSNGNYQEVKED